MPFVPADNVAQVAARYTVSGQQVENTLYFEHTSEPDEAALLVIATFVGSWRDTFLKAIQGAHCSFREAYAVSLQTAFSPTATYTPASPIAGTYSGTPLPNNTTLAVSFRTNGRGRSARGRNYAVGLTETALSSTLGQAVQATYAADIIEAYEYLLTDTPADWSWVIVSRYVNGSPRANGLVIPVTNVILTDLTVDSQRRRLPGRGT